MEVWDLYTQDREKTGKTMVRGDKTPQGLFHLQVHVCIFNQRGQMLIQQRQSTKQWYPDLWDYSVGGSAVAGDNSIAAAQREALEELGVHIDLAGRCPAVTRWYGAIIDDYYIVTQDVNLSELTLQAEEVQTVRWANCEEILTLLREKKFCPNPSGMITLLFELSEEARARKNQGRLD